MAQVSPKDGEDHELQNANPSTMTTDDESLPLSHTFEEDDRVQSSAFDLWTEAPKLFRIGVPSVLIQFALYWIFPVSASSVGRKLGSVELGGFSLGCLVGNLTCLSLMEGSLSAADTLMPRAYGSERYEELGRLAIRATVCGTFLLAIPVAPLCLYSGAALQYLGQDPEASALAQSWIQVYFLGAAPNLLFRVIMRFLLSQHKPWPLVFASFVPSIVIHPFLLEYCVSRIGFIGSALSIAATQWITLIVLLILLNLVPIHKAETWPGLSLDLIQRSLQCGPIFQFLKLSIGGILSMTEWWFFELMCFIAGSFGVESLDAHTIAYNLVPLLFMLPLGLSIGLSVRMGNVIATSPEKAKIMAGWCMAFVATLGSVISFTLYQERMQVIHMFTTDHDVIRLASEIWPFLCYYVFLIYIMGISLAILRALGMQWRAAGIISASLYGITLPAVAYFAIYCGGGLLALWKVLPSCYTILQVALAMGYLVLDWQSYSRRVRESIARMAANSLRTVPQEETPLLV